MLYNYIGQRIIDRVEQRMNTKELSIYDFKASYVIREINNEKIPELSLQWETTNPSLTFYEISSLYFNTNFSDRDYKYEHNVNVLLNKESFSVPLKIKIIAEDITETTYALEFDYIVKEQEPEIAVE